MCSPNVVTATAACGGAIVALGGSYDMRSGMGIACARSIGGIACPNPARVLGPTSTGPTIQSYNGPLVIKAIESYAHGKAEAASPGWHTEGLDCNTCANNAANDTCNTQVSACDEDTSCSSCISCLFADASATVSSCGCDLSNQATGSLASCLLQACPVCGGASGMGGSATSTLLPDGAPCSSNDDCQSCICDMDTSTCGEPS